MAIYAISYDLISPGQKYTQIDRYFSSQTAIKALNTYWLLDTTSSAESVLLSLQSLLDQNDKALVTRLTGNWHSVGLSSEVVSWLKSSYRNW